jgi:hypothetical protein
MHPFREADSVLSGWKSEQGYHVRGRGRFIHFDATVGFVLIMVLSHNQAMIRVSRKLMIGFYLCTRACGMRD